MTRTSLFVAATAAVVGWEVWAVWRRDPRNRTWTSLLVEHVPWPVAAAGTAALVCWLPRHLYRAYRQALANAAVSAIHEALSGVLGEAVA